MARFSRRERLLIFILVFLLMAVGIFEVFLKPAVERMMEAQIALDYAKLRREEMETLLSESEELQKEVHENREKYSMAAEAFLAPMDAEEVDEMMNALMDSCSLTARSMTITFETVGKTCSLCRVRGEALGDKAGIRSFLSAIAESSSMEVEEFFIEEDDTEGVERFDFAVNLYMMERLEE